MIERKEYLNTLIDFKDKHIIKVLTGIRRCGKSTLFILFQNYLLNNEVTKEQIISINFEDIDYEELLDYKALYKYIKERLIPNKMNYIFLDEKVQAIKNAKNAGLNICSGGIMGLGETMEDRIDMALELRELGVLSIPVNILNPIKGTPFENNKLLTNDEICRIVAVYRFLIPRGAIRLAGGRGLLQDKGESCFLSGANAAISGDMLTTSGITIKEDMNLLNKIGYKPALLNE